MQNYPYDILGNIAIVKFKDKTKKSEKTAFAKNLLKQFPNIKTIVEKSDKVKGRLRIAKTSYLAGEKTKTAVYKENSCIFNFDINETYFSPRLSNERKEIAQQVKNNENVCVMFAGVAPFSIVIARLAKPKKVYSIEINRKASKYAEENAKLNKVANKVEIIQGDVKKAAPKLKKQKIKFDRIVMARPNLKDTFLPQAFQLIKKSGIINYYGFGDDHEVIKDQIQAEAKKAKRKIKILKIKKAGDIAPFRFRWRVDFKVLN